jgi:hypothetical protein
MQGEYEECRGAGAPSTGAAPVQTAQMAQSATQASTAAPTAAMSADATNQNFRKLLRAGGGQAPRKEACGAAATLRANSGDRAPERPQKIGNKLFLELHANRRYA